MPDDDRESWDNIVKLAKQAGAGKNGPGDTTAPQRFVAHMRQVRRSLWDLAKALLWRRLSLVAMVVALVLYLIARLILSQDPAPSIPTPHPPSPLSP